MAVQKAVSTTRRIVDIQGDGLPEGHSMIVRV